MTYPARAEDKNMKHTERDPAAERIELEAYFNHLLAEARADFQQNITKRIDESLVALQMRERRISADRNAALRKLEAEAAVEAEELNNTP